MAYYKYVCIECNRMARTEKAYQDYPDDFLCSLECKETWHKREDERTYEIRLKKIPAKFRGLETFRQEKLGEVFGKNLFIFGSPGTGKTVFMCDILKRFAKQSRKFKFINFLEWMIEVKKMVADADMNPWDEINEIAEYDGMLAIDDLGAERFSDFVREALYIIINHREQHGLPLMITTNLTLNEIDERVDSRISSRIAGLCGGDGVLDFGKEDKRLGEHNK